MNPNFEMKRKIIFFCCFVLLVLQTNAQCAMCRAVLVSEEGQATAEGVNDGIMYLMAVPYVMVAGIGFAIYWQFFRSKKSS